MAHDPAGGARAETALCAHCGGATAPGERFCCAGCAAAFATIQELGLGRYYRDVVRDTLARRPLVDPTPRTDLARHVRSVAGGGHELNLAVDGLQCGACVWLIESVLARDPCVTAARVNMTTRRLRLSWRGAAEEAPRLVGSIERLGYRLVPFDPASLEAARDRTGRELMRALAVAGFAAANVMLPAIAIWIGLFSDMGPATRALLHWVSAAIALPAIIYASRPFWRSAWGALRQGRTNMDVPISVGVTLVTAMSLVQTVQHAEHAYFDSAVALLFFLLIGRVLDHSARAHARAAAEQLIALQQSDVGVIAADGTVSRRDAATVAAGTAILVGPGERIGVDGEVVAGEGLIDSALVTGESLPVVARPGSIVFAGTLNLGAALTLRATAAGGGTLLAECVRLMEAAEARRGRFVVFADRVARRYAPVVHGAALLTFLWWWAAQGMAVADALLIGAAVLIITCPCALALAVPAVQVIGTGRLFRRGVLVKSPTALERLAAIDTVVFDKTGTLTDPALHLVSDHDSATLRLAAGLAASSRHPLARALAAAAGPAVAAAGVREVVGAGLERDTPAGPVRLGSAGFAGVADSAAMPALYLARPGAAAVRFDFAETLRPDAAATIAALRALGMEVQLLSGDHAAAVAAAAGAAGIATWRAGCTPVDKVAAIEALRAAGRRVLMVGDGLNDGPCLAAADASISPSSAAEISQNAADVVFQGASLAPVAAVIATARHMRRLTWQNIALSLAYNVVMVPVAMAGLVTPWLAALAMSSSSLLVIANSFRLHRLRDAVP
ncbi:MAG: cadmium-translocating P-type ATPase [Acetobacteraceae bacterium]|nr:cadmium-translocating P-type ATPase [Acetobacteraceae bacterium]